MLEISIMGAMLKVRCLLGGGFGLSSASCIISFIIGNLIGSTILTILF